MHGEILKKVNQAIIEEARKMTENEQDKIKKLTLKMTSQLEDFMRDEKIDIRDKICIVDFSLATVLTNHVGWVFENVGIDPLELLDEINKLTIDLIKRFCQ